MGTLNFGTKKVRCQIEETISCSNAYTGKKIFGTVVSLVESPRKHRSYRTNGSTISRNRSTSPGGQPMVLGQSITI